MRDNVMFAYVQHIISNAGYMWQAFNIPEECEDVQAYIMGRGYDVQKLYTAPTKKKRNAEGKRHRKPNQAARNLYDAWNIGRVCHQPVH